MKGRGKEGSSDAEEEMRVESSLARWSERERERVMEKSIPEYMTQNLRMKITDVSQLCARDSHIRLLTTCLLEDKEIACCMRGDDPSG